MKTTMYRLKWRLTNGARGGRGGLSLTEAEWRMVSLRANPEIAEFEIYEVHIGDGPTKSTVIKTWKRAEQIKEKVR